MADKEEIQGSLTSGLEEWQGVALSEYASIQGDGVSAGDTLSTAWQLVDPTTLTKQGDVAIITTDWALSGSDYVIVVDGSTSGTVLYPIDIVTADGGSIDLTKPTIIKSMLTEVLYGDDDSVSICIVVKCNDSASDHAGIGWRRDPTFATYTQDVTEVGGTVSGHQNALYASNPYLGGTITTIDATGNSVDLLVYRQNTADPRAATLAFNAIGSLVGDFEFVGIAIISKGTGASGQTFKLKDLLVYALSLESMDLP